MDRKSFLLGMVSGLVLVAVVGLSFGEGLRGALFSGDYNNLKIADTSSNQLVLNTGYVKNSTESMTDIQTTKVPDTYVQRVASDFKCDGNWGYLANFYVGTDVNKDSLNALKIMEDAYNSGCDFKIVKNTRHNSGSVDFVSDKEMYVCEKPELIVFDKENSDGDVARDRLFQCVNGHIDENGTWRRDEFFVTKDVSSKDVSTWDATDVTDAGSTASVDIFVR